MIFICMVLLVSEMCYMNKTLEYYNHQSVDYNAETFDLKFTDIQDRFLSYIKQNSLILDFGCGSGRDTKYFLSKGFRVEAVDGSEEMVKIASRNTGIQVKQMLFSELNEVNRYDGIFACASILHIPYKDLPAVFTRMKKALKDNGIIYASFKYGDFEGYRSDRYYTDLTEERLSLILNQVGDFEVLEMNTTVSVIPGRDEELWLNVIAKKQLSSGRK